MVKTREEKNVAERKRRERIKNDKTLYDLYKQKDRERYYKKKMEGRTLSIKDMTPQQQNITRMKNRAASKRYYNKKKSKGLYEELVSIAELIQKDEDESALLETSPPHSIDNQNMCDPLESEQTADRDSRRKAKKVTLPESSTSKMTPRRSTRLKLVSENICSTLRLDQSTHQDTHPDAYTSTEPSTSKMKPRCSTRPQAVFENQDVETENVLSSNITSPSSSITVMSPKSVTRRRCSFSDIDSTEPDSPKSDSSVPRGPLTTCLNRLNIPNITETSKTNALRTLRRYRYETNKKFRLLHNRIADLKKDNYKYKKQLHRLKMVPRQKLTGNSPKSIFDNTTERKKEVIGNSMREKKMELERSAKRFFEEDEISIQCPGKKDCITRNKIKKQKRYLTDSVKNLHKKYLELHPNHKICYTRFCSMKPFWVVKPNIEARETCLCKTHENIEFIVGALKRHSLIREKNVKDIITALCCDKSNRDCLKRACTKCRDKHIMYNEFDNSEKRYYWTWTRQKQEYFKDGKEKTCFRTIKQKIEAHPKEIIEEFEKQLFPYMKHEANLISQQRYIKHVRTTLRHNECMIHCDFSENYSTKYNREIQSVHFGASRQQITLHTVVLYYWKNGEFITKCFCTISDSLRHDAIAIWEHLMPILGYIEKEIPHTEALFFVSDSPSGQYRNKKMFFVMTALHWNFPSLRTVEWNYSETGHGKGSPDGIGGTLKRTADQAVAEGGNIPDISALISLLMDKVKGITIDIVYESNMLEKELLLPPKLNNFIGTMKVHQVVWNDETGGTLTMRMTSCMSPECFHSTALCNHGQHIGYYTVSDNTNRTTAKTTLKMKSADPKLIKKSKTHPIVTSNILLKPANVTSKNDSDINLSETDSFWLPDVAKDYDDLVTPTFLSHLNMSREVKTPSLDNNNKAMSNDSDSDDFNIF